MIPSMYFKLVYGIKFFERFRKSEEDDYKKKKKNLLSCLFKAPSSGICCRWG
jgi:hypothetical protein